jgi:hypothetical protein
METDIPISARRINICGGSDNFEGLNAVEPQPVASLSRSGSGPAILNKGSGSACTSPGLGVDPSGVDTSSQLLLHGLIKEVSQSDLRIRPPGSDPILLRDSAMTSVEPDTPAGSPPMEDEQPCGGQAQGKAIFRI